MRVFIGTALLFVTLAVYFTCSALASDSTKPLMLMVEEQVNAFGGEAHVEPDWLEIKFRDGQLIRLRDGIPNDLAGTGLNSPEAQYLLTTVLAGANWLRSQDVPEDKIDQLRAEAQHVSGTAMPDLNLYFRLWLPAGLDPNHIAVMLLQLPEVEAVYRVPRPAPLPAVPDYYSGTASAISTLPEAGAGRRHRWIFCAYSSRR